MPWRPDSGSPNRGFVRASEVVWVAYHKRLKDVERTWRSEPPAPGEYAVDVEDRMEAAARMRESELRELREAVRQAVEREGQGGPYLIPV